MRFIIKSIKFFLSYIFIIILILLLCTKISSTGKINMSNSSNGKINDSANIESFNLAEQNITYNSSTSQISETNIVTFPSENLALKQGSNVKINTKVNNELSSDRKAVLDRAQAMVDVKWTPKYNLTNKYAPYIFVKGKTYTGIPYSMDFYQVRTTDDFLSKIGDSKIIYGNDCSGFVSVAWEISRQTTLDFYEAVKKQKKIDGKSVVEIPWEDLKPGDALLLDNGKGKGHIMLYISEDKEEKDKINVYEQNVPTIKPLEPIPVARKAIRSKETLKKAGYFPIRLKVGEEKLRL